MWFLCENEEEQQIIEADIRPSTGQKPDYLTSVSRPYYTKEELWAGCRILHAPCNICGKLIKSHYHEEVRAELIEHNMCFSCNLWRKRAEQIKTDSRIMVVDHYWYTVVEEYDGPGYRGFGGREFRFLTNDGRLIVGKNVWGGGTINPHWHSKIPDNAKLIKEEYGN